MWTRAARTSVLAAWIAVLVAVPPADAACTLQNIYQENSGSARVTGSTSLDGVRATVDLSPVSAFAGKTVVHPLQWSSSISNDFVGWGTYNGYGTHKDGAISNCPDDYSGWNVYIDGIAFGTYFCFATGIQLGNSQDGTMFKLSFGANQCDSNRFAGYLDNTFTICAALVNGVEGNGAAGGEAATPQHDILNTTVHYYDVKKRTYSTGTWTAWSAGMSFCEAGYDVNLIQNDNFWAQPQ